MSFFAVLLLAVAVSMDGLGAGVACGLKGVRVPFPSVALMGLAAGSAVLVSMMMGVLVGSFINPRWAVLAGA